MLIFLLEMFWIQVTFKPD